MAESDLNLPRWSAGFPTDNRRLHQPMRLPRSNHAQVTVSIAPAQLGRVDTVAHREFPGRSALPTMWINNRLGHEVS
jgi:hypothetical protein